MKHRIAICAGLAALGVAAATSAQAQAYVEPPPGYGGPPQPMVHDGLPPNEVLMIARSSGLRPLTQPARRGPHYVLLASDNMGGQLRVVVNAQDGTHRARGAGPRSALCLCEPPSRPRGLVPVAPPQHAAAPPPGYGAAPPPDLNTPTPPLPRTARTTPPQQTPPAAGGSQKSNLAGAPDATGSVPTRPARTPLPRPRPAIAANEASAGAAAPTPQAPSTPRAAAPKRPRGRRLRKPSSRRHRRRAPRPRRRRRPKRRWSRSRRSNRARCSIDIAQNESAPAWPGRSLQSRRCRSSCVTQPSARPPWPCRCRCRS